MDLEAAREHRGKLQVELDAISNGATTLSLVPRLVTMGMCVPLFLHLFHQRPVVVSSSGFECLTFFVHEGIEVRRLDEDITRESLISLSDPREGACCITVAVEGVLMLPKVSNEFGFKDQTPEEGFVEGLKAELEAVNNFHHPLPLTSQLIQRVIDCMEEHIASGRTPRRLFESIYHDGSVDDAQQAGAGEGSSSSSAEAEAAAEEAAVAAVAAAVAAQKPAERQRTRFWRENLHQGITDAIGRANQQNPQGATFDQVVDMLRQNPSIEFDEEVRSIAYERFLGAVYFPDTPVDQSKCGQQ